MLCGFAFFSTLIFLFTSHWHMQCGLQYTMGKEKPTCRTFIGLKLTQPASDKQEPQWKFTMFRNAFLTILIVAATAFFGSSNASAQNHHSHHGSHGNSHKNLHQDLRHNEFHRQQYHADQHQFPQTNYQHFRLHQDLDHDRYHDKQSHRSFHNNQSHGSYHGYRPSYNSYRPSYNSYPQYSSGFGMGFSPYGFSLRIGR